MKVVHETEVEFCLDGEMVILNMALVWVYEHEREIRTDSNMDHIIHSIKQITVP